MGVLAFAVALGGQPAWADDTEVTAAPSTTAEPTTTPIPEPTATETPSAPATEVPGTQPAPEAPPVETPEAPTQPMPTGLETQPGADLRITAAFDRAEYTPWSDLPIAITVENVGDAYAHGIRFTHSGSVQFASGGYRLDQTYSLEPGQQLRIDVVARQLDSQNQLAEFSIQVEHAAVDPTPADNAAKTTADVRYRKGRVAGVLYTDANANGQYDVGEGRPEARLNAWGGEPQTSLSAVTDATGAFVFEDAPTGSYVIRLNDPRVAIKPGFGRFTVQPDTTTELRLPTARPLYDMLGVRMEFERDAYQRNDQVGLWITLTNKTTEPLANIVAVCDPWQGDDVLDGTGPGWAALHPDGPGVTLAPGETRVLTVQDVIPDGAFFRGTVDAICNFGNNGSDADGYVGSSDSAKVLGALGDAAGFVKHHSASGTSTPLENVKLVVLDPTTKAVVARTETGPGGEFRINGLQVAREPYEALVLGPYRPKDGRTFTFTVGSGGVGWWHFDVVDGPLVEDPSVSKINIKVTASFDKASYDIRDNVTATVKIANTGTGHARGVKFESRQGNDDLRYDSFAWGDLAPWARGMDFAPGQEHVVTLTGDLRYSRGEIVKLTGRINASGDVDPADNEIALSAPVTYPKGDAVAIVYGDADQDGRYDEGEALPGVHITFEGGTPRKWVAADTDASGRYRLDDVPTGTYAVGLEDRNTGWVRHGRTELVVTENQETTVQYRMVRPLSDKLHASLVYDRDSYGPADPVAITITLSNTGDAPILAKASCGSAELPSADNGDEWGPFRWKGGEGVEIAAGATRVFTVVDQVPAGAADYGMFGTWCTFGPDTANGNPWASDLARVPGVQWTVSGKVINGNRQDAPVVPGVKIVLLDYFTNRPVARTFADAQGRFTFADVQTGYYTAVLVGPWRFKTDWGPYPMFKVTRGRPTVDIYVEPGPDVADPDGVPGANPGGDAGANPPAGESGESGGGGEGGLAATGAGVFGLGLLGLLVLAFGVATRVIGRRRTA